MDQVVRRTQRNQFVLILMMILSGCEAGQRFSESKNRSCTPAEEPVLDLHTDCHPLDIQDKPFCQHYGLTLEKFVNWSGVVESQYAWNRNLWKLQEAQRRVFREFPISPECMKQARFIGCYYSFPGCDRTTSKFKTRRICKETCLDFFKNCKRFLNVWLGLYMQIYPQLKSLSACTGQSYRNAGDSPECMFYVKSNNETIEKEDCLYLNGSSYYGNISVTASGITCQSWKEQCPHRHTMNTTYPELNFAENYCRNPRNSGKQPWCFTTNRSKRWEYCNIPKCTPVNGGYGNWSSNATCSVTCGEGFQVWSRKCNNPKPKYGGNNCSVLGNATEYRNCTKKLCAEDCIYSTWTKSSSCSATCGNGYEIWTRECYIQDSKNGKDCCKPIFTINITLCHTIPCSGSPSSQARSIQITSFVCGSFILVVFVVGFLLKKKFKRQQKFAMDDGRMYESILDTYTDDGIYDTIPAQNKPEHVYENIPEETDSFHVYESISRQDLVQKLE